MTLHRTLLAAAIASSITGTAVGAETFNGKTMAMSGVGVANAHYSHGVLLNPANAVRFHESDDFNMNLNGGVVGSDEDEMIDSADDLSTQLDALDTLDFNTDTADLRDIVTTLEKLDDASANAVVGANITIGIPSTTVSAVFFINGTGGVQVGSQIDDQDIQDINDLITAIDNNDPGSAPTINVDADLNSRVTATGLMLTEVGIGFGKEFDFGGQPVALGLSPKYQKVTTIAYSEIISDIDSDNFDADQYSVDDSNFNLDFGISTHWDHVYVGLSVINLISQDYETADPTREVKLETQTTLGISYTNGWGTAALDVDLNPVQYLGTDSDVQFVKLGAEINLYRTVQFRLGYRHDLEDSFDDTFSVGFGLSPFDVVNLDIAAMAGGDDTLGAALQLGFSF